MKVPPISDNPLRVLGVFANATQREIEKNKTKLRAFSHVGQEVQLPLWLNGLKLLPPLTDVTEEKLAQAQAQLSLQKERDRHALFWFEQDKNHVQDEDKAIELLNNNRVDEARQLWEQRTDRAAQKNLLLLAVMDDDWDRIIASATLLFRNDTASFHSFMEEVLKLSSEANGLRSHELLLHINDETRRAEMKQMLVRNHQHFLDEAIDRLKRMKSEDTAIQKEEIEKMIAARSHVEALRYLLGSDNSFTCSYYANQTAKALVNALAQYSGQQYLFSEYKWAAKIVNEIWKDIDFGDPENKDIWRKKIAIDARAKVRQTDNSGGNDGCLDSIKNLIAYFLILFFAGFLFRSGCGRRKEYRSPYRYNYQKYYTPPKLKTPPTITVPKITVPSIEEKPGYIYIGGRYVSIDSMREFVEEKMLERARKEALKAPTVTRVTLDQQTIDSLMELFNEHHDIPQPMEQMEEEADTIAAQTLPAETADTETEQTEEYEGTDSTMNEHE